VGYKQLFGFSVEHFLLAEYEVRGKILVKKYPLKDFQKKHPNLGI